jgi:hypothetical protein
VEWAVGENQESGEDEYFIDMERLLTHNALSPIVFDR